MAVSYRFDIVDGPRSGEKIALKPGERTVIGRSKQGIDLLDPRVSTRHAELSWDQGRLWVQDLNSAMGTMVDGVAIGPDPVPLSDGHRLLVGDSVLLYIEERRLLPQWVYWVALVVLVASAPVFILRMVEIKTPWSKIHPVVDAGTAVNGHDGPLHPQGYTNLVPADRCFLRETLPLGAGSYVSRVTDQDGDQVSELWMSGRDWERIYTFAPNGSWELLGDLPGGCTFTPGAGNRPLTCDIRQYRFEAGIPFSPSAGRCARGSNKGHWELADRRNRYGGTLDGVFVWLPNREETGPAGAPRPYAVGVKDMDNLAGWLYERGIDEPVHFVVCEEMFKGMSAQVLTQSGRIELLKPGCGYSLELQGNRTDEGLTAGELPVAVAFTDTGRRILGEQISVFLGGSELSHFQSYQQQEWSQLASSTPALRTADFLVVPPPSVVRRTQLPREDPDLRLEPQVRLYGQTVPGLLRAATWVWTKPSTVLRTPCGEIVQIDARDVICPRPCLSGSTFMSINVPNHGGKFNVPYKDVRNQRFTTPDGKVEISVSVWVPGDLVTQAIAASVAARDTQACQQNTGPTTPPILRLNGGN